MMSFDRLCKRNEGNFQRKRGREKARYLLKYSFAPKNHFRFVLSRAKIYHKNITTYTGALRYTYSFTFTIQSVSVVSLDLMNFDRILKDWHLYIGQDVLKL